MLNESYALFSSHSEYFLRKFLDFINVNEVESIEI